jgi:uncharacterized protein YdcH (DUF465 family)
MHDRDEELKEELVATDDEFRRLHEEHQNFEKRLEELTLKSLPSEEDESEEKQIKLQKLHLKDRMEAILRAHRHEEVAV